MISLTGNKLWEKQKGTSKVPIVWVLSQMQSLALQYQTPASSSDQCETNINVCKGKYLNLRNR